jgi:hypothetical protein
MEGKMASNKKSVPNLSGLARGSDPAKSHKDAPGRHQFSAENQPPKAKVGRPKGAQNKLTKSLKALLVRAVTEVGDSIVPGKDGKGGLLGYLKVSAVVERKTVMILLGRALPLQVNATVAHKTILSREEAIAELKLRGLPDEIIEMLQPVEYVLDGPDPYGDDDAIDPEPAK